MVINGSVAPRPIVNSNDDASSAMVERRRVVIMISFACHVVIILCLRSQITRPLRLVQVIAVDGRTSGPAKIMIYPGGRFFATLILFTKIPITTEAGV